MAEILREQIALMEPERLTDEDDGGGRETANQIADGQSNNLFPDISRLDRVYGRVNMREAFLRVLTEDTWPYYGAHVILTKGPQDEKVTALAFKTGDPDNTRDEARDFLESYVTRSTLHSLRFLGNQLAGQRSIQAYQRTSEHFPEIGEVLCLVQNEGQNDERYQFVRVKGFDWEDRTFQNDSTRCGIFTMRVFDIVLTTTLEYTFNGGEADCFTTLESEYGFIRQTQVADAAKYYGISDLAEDISIGDMELKVTDLYQKIVPSSRGETILADIIAGGLVAQKITSGGEEFDIIGPSHTGRIEITLANRAFSYVFNCQPIPAPGALAIDFKSMGKWYSASIDESGALVGEASGQLNYETGTIPFTLNAMPDIGSAILFTWVTRVHFADAAGETFGASPVVVTGDFGQYVNRASAVFTWYSGGALQTANGSASGAVDGDGEGFISPNGMWWLNLTANVPDYDSTVVVDYDPTPVHAETFGTYDPSNSGSWDGTLIANLSERPLAGSVEASWIVKVGTGTATQTVTKLTATKEIKTCKTVPVGEDPGGEDPEDDKRYTAVITVPASFNHNPNAAKAVLECSVPTFDDYDSLKAHIATINTINTCVVNIPQTVGGTGIVNYVDVTVTKIRLVGADQAEWDADADAAVAENVKVSVSIKEV